MERVIKRDDQAQASRACYTKPARNYMESSLEEKQPEIVAGFQSAVDQAAYE
jgi:hypothetical protein